jgi:hypothetical protein
MSYMLCTSVIQRPSHQHCKVWISIIFFSVEGNCELVNTRVNENGLKPCNHKQSVKKGASYTKTMADFLHTHR